MFRCVFTFALVIAAICSTCLNRTAYADLILGPSGTVLYNGNNPGDDVTQISGLNLKFFGQNVSNVWVAENGNLNFSADGSFFPTPLGAPSIARIAPLWDDFLLLQNQSNTIDNRVLVDAKPGQYLAVTWLNVRLFLETVAGANFPTTTRSAQVVWFETDQLINGMQYRAGDIAFGYVPHEVSTSSFGIDLNAVVGLDSGTGVVVTLPGAPNSSVTAANSHLLGAQNQVVLFRPDAGGGYSASLQIVSIPEPTSIALACLGISCFLLTRRRVG